MAPVGPDDEILEFAIAREIEAYNFYMALAERVASPEMRLVLQDFAKEELEHKAKLELEVMKQGRTVPPEPRAKIAEHDYIIADDQVELDMDYKDILKMAIEKEDAAFRTYIRLLSGAFDAESREVLLGIAEQEVKHKLRFETEYEMLIKEK